jgi:hypothetical protein
VKYEDKEVREVSKIQADDLMTACRNTWFWRVTLSLFRELWDMDSTENKKGTKRWQYSRARRLYRFNMHRRIA